MLDTMDGCPSTFLCPARSLTHVFEFSRRLATGHVCEHFSCPKCSMCVNVGHFRLLPIHNPCMCFILFCQIPNIPTSTYAIYGLWIRSGAKLLRVNPLNLECDGRCIAFRELSTLFACKDDVDHVLRDKDCSAWIVDSFLYQCDPRLFDSELHVRVPLINLQRSDGGWLRTPCP